MRLYVFLTQYIDRCEDEAARKEYPEAELQNIWGDSRQDGGHPKVKRRLKRNANASSR